jgi:hypothetical protein
MYWNSIHGALVGVRLAENQITNFVKIEFALMVPVPYNIILIFVAYSFLYLHYNKTVGWWLTECNVSVLLCSKEYILTKKAYAFCRNRSFISKVYNERNIRGPTNVFLKKINFDGIAWKSYLRPTSSTIFVETLTRCLEKTCPIYGFASNPFQIYYIRKLSLNEV